MKLTRRSKILAGVATAAYIGLPFIIAGLVMLMALAMPLLVMLNEQGGRGEPDFLVVFPFLMMGVMFPTICLLAPLTIGLLVFYLAHIIKNTGASDTTRVVLAVGLVFMPMMVMPLYYFMHIWPESEAPSPSATSAIHP